MALQDLHKCGAIHIKTAPVHEVFQGQTVWQGDVEVFELNGHPQAKRAYGWSHHNSPTDAGERFTTILDVLPVVSPVSALCAAIIAGAIAKKK